MGPNSRPPLSSRIRASFDGKRSQSSESTLHAHVHGFAPVDPEILRNAIDHAINSETFQIAIATSLANIIKPSIKSALDTIQPVVETVYQHDMLLRRTNASVENLLERFDTNNLTRPSRSGDEDLVEDETRSMFTIEESSEPKKLAPDDSPSDEHLRSILSEYHTNYTEKSLKGLSNVLDGNNKMLTDLVASVDDIYATVAPSTDHISSLRAVTEQSTTATSVMQAQLDQLQIDVASITAAVGANGTMNDKTTQDSSSGLDASILATHTTKLDSVAANLAELKDCSTKLNVLQSLCDNTHNLQSQVGALNSQMGNMRTTVDSHGTRNLDEQGSILAAVQKSHSMHASHSAALDELKSRDIAAPTSTLPTQDNSETALAIEGLTSDLASLRENMNVRLDTNATQFLTLGTKIDTVLDIVEAIKDGDYSAEILDGIRRSNDSHAAHAATLEGASVNRGVSDVATSDSNVEPHLENIVRTLDLHSATLATIHNYISTASRNSVGEEFLEPKLEQIVSLLHEITDSDVSAEILTGIHSCTEMVAELKESDVSAEILTAMHDSNESHASYKSVLSDVRSYSKAGLDEHASHTAALNELKSKVPRSTATDALTTAVPLDISGLETQLDAIIDNLDSQKLLLSDLKVNHASKPAPATVPADPELLNTVRNNHEELLGNLAGLKAAVQESRVNIAMHGESVEALHEDTKSAHEETKASHAGLSDAVKALTIGGVAGTGAAALTSHDKGNNDDVLAAIHTVETAVIDISDKIDSVKGDVDENEMTIKGLLKDVSDEIKAEIDASITDLGASIGTIGGDVRVLRGIDIRAAVEDSRQDIKNAIEGLGEQFKSTGVKVVDVSAGMQSRNRANSRTMAKQDLVPEEGSWMRRPPGEKTDTSVPATAEDAEPAEKEISPLPTPVVEKGDNKEGEEEPESGSTSGITSPLSPAFSIDSKGGKKKAKKDKAEKKENKGKKGKYEGFVFDPEPEGEGQGEERS